MLCAGGLVCVVSVFTFKFPEVKSALGSEAELMFISAWLYSSNSICFQDEINTCWCICTDLWIIVIADVRFGLCAVKDMFCHKENIYTTSPVWLEFEIEICILSFDLLRKYWAKQYTVVIISKSGLPDLKWLNKMMIFLKKSIPCWFSYTPESHSYCDQTWCSNSNTVSLHYTTCAVEGNVFALIILLAVISVPWSSLSKAVSEHAPNMCSVMSCHAEPISSHHLHETSFSSSLSGKSSEW